jgi:hypothetical protein
VEETGVPIENQDASLISMTFYTFQDTSLISIANIFHRSGYINDAIVATNLALDTANKVAVSHFTMANLYAVKVCVYFTHFKFSSSLGGEGAFSFTCDCIYIRPTFDFCSMT